MTEPQNNGNVSEDIDWEQDLDGDKVYKSNVTRGGGHRAGTSSFFAGGIFAPSVDDSQAWAYTKGFVGQFAKDATELVVGEIPVVGDAVAAKEAIAGTNIYGEELSTIERAAAAGSLIPGGKLAGKAAEGLGILGRGLGNLFGLGGRQADKLADASRRLPNTKSLDSGAGRSGFTDTGAPKGVSSANAPRGFCFVAGTPVLKHAGAPRLTETQYVQADAEPADDSSSSLLLAASAAVVAIAGGVLPSRRSRKQPSGDPPRNRQRNRNSEHDSHDE